MTPTERVLLLMVTAIVIRSEDKAGKHILRMAATKVMEEGDLLKKRQTKKGKRK